jgi:molybdenum cofactor cytidylyltransferase
VIAAVLLAAGESSRMGSLKQLLPWDGRTLLEWQVAQLREAGVDDIVIVLGHEATRIAPVAAGTGARVVINDAYREGRASSLRCGSQAIDDGAVAVIVLSVDQPRPGWIARRLIERWRERRAPLTVPVMAGRRGHPILVDGALLQELRSVTEAGLGLREVMERHRDATDQVPIDNASLSFDLNTPSDYQMALSSFNNSDWNEKHAK